MKTFDELKDEAKEEIRKDDDNAIKHLIYGALRTVVENKSRYERSTDHLKSLEAMSREELLLKCDKDFGRR